MLVIALLSVANRETAIRLSPKPEASDCSRALCLRLVRRKKEYSLHASFPSVYEIGCTLAATAGLASTLIDR